MSTFISYSRIDSSFAIRLAKDLKLEGYDAWLDQLDIPVGARWDDELANALESCTTLIIVLSPESIRSQNVKDEVGYAIDAGKQILPVRIKPGEMPFRLRRFEYVDFTNQSYEDGLEEVKNLISSGGSAPPEMDVEEEIAQEETRPAMHRTVRMPRSIPAAEPEAPAPPRTGRLLPRGLMIGLAAVAVLAIAAFAIRAMATREPPATAQPAAATATENPPTQTPTAAPTEDTAADETQAEAFLARFLDDGEMNDWKPLLRGLGRKEKVSVTPSNEGLVFHLDDPDLRAYYFYEPVVYEDVIIRMQVENLGQNTNYVSLVCRRTEDTWYEFRIRAAALWTLYDYRGQYNRLDDGGTRAGNPGRAVNEYEMRCIGAEISLRVNGQEEASYTVL
ncbi:MAG TPA: toll/interleukin-1 receptor domain-containing protein, partial [Anaerolineales bacterium]|nr:toll/interleukin-1 receptor domain-containing protein [Anaerolineales bacterium]